MIPRIPGKPGEFTGVPALYRPGWTEDFYPRSCSIIQEFSGLKNRNRGVEKIMADLPINEDLIRDLLSRISSSDESEREAAVEALAVSTEDDDWRPNELIRQGGIEIIAGLLGDTNTHVVVSALNIIIATAAAGCEEELISEGVIAVLDPMQDHDDRLIRSKVREALWLLAPEVDEAVTSKPQDEY